MSLKKIKKHKSLNENQLITILAVWQDISFDHAFGHELQGFYEVTKVLINGMNIPLDILDSKFLEGLDDYVNE